MPSVPPIPPAFLQRMSRFLGEEYPAFASSLGKPPEQALRVNTLKLAPARFRAISPYPLGDPVEWCPSAFHISGEGSSFGKHPYHAAGLYYLQDPSAMAPAEILSPQPGERVLDLAAAPGGKTTALAALMQGQGLLVANEIKDNRLGHLAVNVECWGAGNVVVTNETPERLADHFGAYFDRVLVDAPCSGEGMFRKDLGARQDWSAGMIAGCSIRQRNILRVAAHLVKPGGYLLYSTCTFAPEEDEGIINSLLLASSADSRLPRFQVVDLPLQPGFLRGQPGWLGDIPAAQGLEGAVRLLPHRLRGEGHFACLLRRVDDHDQGRPAPASERMQRPNRVQAAIWQAFAGGVLSIDLPIERLRLRGERLYLVPAGMPDLGSLRAPLPGVWLGTFKKERFEPAHPLALFLKPGEAAGSVDLHLEGTKPGASLLAYLRGESLPSSDAPGWVLVTVGGWPLGWGKRVQGTLKNHYPRGWQVSSW